MKQHITKEQWNELSEKEKLNFVYCPSIGEMIEFLGQEDSHYIDDFASKVCWYADENRQWGVAIGWWCETDELCDALWEACKYKLKK